MRPASFYERAGISPLGADNAQVRGISPGGTIPRPKGHPSLAQRATHERVRMIRFKSRYSVRVMVSMVFLAFFLAGGNVFVEKAEAKRKNIPVKKIPIKRIPKIGKYRQATAFNKRPRKNRRLVIETRRSNRQLRRTGSAYEDN